MPSCVVKWCKNYTTSQKKCQGITFHRFPTGNEPWKDDWTRIIRNCRGQEDWSASKSSVVCRIHFDQNDLYTTTKGRRRLVTSATRIKLFMCLKFHPVFNTHHFTRKCPRYLSFYLASEHNPLSTPKRLPLGTSLSVPLSVRPSPPPATLTRSSVQRAAGRPTLRLPVRGLHSRTRLFHRSSVLRQTWPAHHYVSVFSQGCFWIHNPLQVKKNF
ncbi:hypothetical protein ABMA27_011361 [Loxostege sticticalis]|uniref:THAP-type domain-containing protein n=1 Tax=Loxostege sticticalis TaxID=481309 RepID=A0ABR3H297_LOXSC